MLLKKLVVTCLVAALAVPFGMAQTSAQPRARSMRLRGPAARGYLGVGVIELTEERAKTLELKPGSGVEVKRVDQNSPAARAGLKEGDVILEVNGTTVEDIAQFTGLIGGLQPSTKVNVTVWRENAKLTLPVTLGARTVDGFPGFAFPALPDFAPPEPDGYLGLPGGSARIGFEGESVSGQLAEYFGVKEGVLVRSVSAKTPAERAGLKAGDVVTRVNGTPVTSPREISSLVRTSRKKSATFTVERNRKEMSLNLDVSPERGPGAERLAL
jgi:serine protease Do